jgi:hypothetical protein
MRRGLLIGLLIAFGCGSAVQTGNPAAAVKSYQRAIKKNDAKTAFSLLSKKTKKRIPYKKFARLWNSRRAELALQSKQLDQALDLDPTLGTRARVTYKDGKRAALSREESFWRLESPLSGSATATKARDAIRLLSKALSRRDYNGVVALLSEERRRAIHDQMVRAFSNSLRKSTDLPLQYVGDKFASLTWEDSNGRYKLVLILEDDEWRIHDVHITPKSNE